MRVRHAVTGVIAAGGMVAVATAPAWSSAAQVTRGDFHAFAVGQGQDITGVARMIRRTDGKTYVEIHLEGLQPGVTYASHVHAAACANGEADGHYKFDPLGAAAPPNEIWPGPLTADHDGVANGRTLADGTAGPEAMSIVVHQPGVAPNKIACADLK